MKKQKRRGAPRKPLWLKKVDCRLTLPAWIMEKLDSLPRSRAVVIEEALIEKYGWKSGEKKRRSKE